MTASGFRSCAVSVRTSTRRPRVRYRNTRSAAESRPCTHAPDDCFYFILFFQRATIPEKADCTVRRRAICSKCAFRNTDALRSISGLAHERTINCRRPAGYALQPYPHVPFASANRTTSRAPRIEDRARFRAFRRNLWRLVRANS